MKEATRVSMCQRIASGSSSIKEGGIMLKVSYRQMKRIWTAYNKQGPIGLIHGNRGKKSNRAVRADERGRMIARYKEKYRDCGPTLALEYLVKEGFSSISPETFRKWLRQQGLSYQSRKVKAHRKRRQRKSCFGDMVQFDGSFHDWFEGRHEKRWLMVMVDDATSAIYAQFAGPEGVKPAMLTVWGWIGLYGCPRLLYCDRKNCYVTQEAKTIEEQLEAKPHHTDFTRACHELGIGVINANSPQAKGRVERVNGTLQDRLVKALRYANINDPERANQFLKETFLPEYNKKFSKAPAEPENHHKKLSAKINLADVFCYHQKRVVQNDWTIQYKNRIFQLAYKQPYRITPRRKVTVAERMDGSIFIIYDKYKLNFKEVSTRKKGHFYVGKKGDISIVA